MLEETVTITGTAEPNKDTTIWIKDQDKKIMHTMTFLQVMQMEV